MPSQELKQSIYDLWLLLVSKQTAASQLAIFVLTCVTLLSATQQAHAQCDAHWIPGPGVAGINGSVRAMATLSNGDIVVGGSFITIDTLVANNIARYTPSTGAWSALGSGLGGTVLSLLVLKNGDILVGGGSKFEYGVPLVPVWQYSSGSGTWTPLGSNISGRAFAMIQLPSGDIIAGGDFYLNGDQYTTHWLVRYSFETDSWTQFDPTRSNDITALALLPNGDILAAGGVSAAPGLNPFPKNQVIRYSASTGVWSTVGSLDGGSVSAMVQLPNGEIFIGGNFVISGESYSNPTAVARYDPLTNAWVHLHASYNARVGCFYALPTGDLLVSGYFSSLADVTASNIIRYTPSSDTWTPVGVGRPNEVDAVVGLSDQRIVAAGSGPDNGYPSLYSFAIYDPATSLWTHNDPGIDAPVTSFAVLPDGDAVVGGDFTRINNITVNHVALYHPSTDTFSPLSDGLSEVPTMLVALPDGDILAAGPFSDPATLSPYGLARYSNLTNTWSPALTQIAGPVNAISILPDGDWLIAGDSLIVTGTSIQALARYSPATDTFSGLNISSGSIQSLTMLANGDLIAIGNFQTSTLTARGIARYSFSNNTWSALPGNPSPPVPMLWTAITLPNQDILATTLLNRETFRYSTTVPVPPVAIPGPIYAIAFLPDGGVIGASENGLSIFNDGTNTWNPQTPYTDQDPVALAVLPNGDILAGGGFNLVGSDASTYFARYTAFAPSTLNISADPQSRLSCRSGQAPFSVTASGEGTLHYQWQLQTADQVWHNLPTFLTCTHKGASVSVTPADSPSVTIKLATCPDDSPTTPHHFQVRCVVFNACHSATSNEATYTVCPADVNCSGKLDITDIFDFLNMWFGHKPAADFNADGAFNITDLFAFLRAWFARC